jgi:Hypothetical protein (DUF2513)
MKRDMELIRKMILAIEDSSDGYAPYPMSIEGYTDGQIGYHAFLLVDAGLASGTNITTTADLGPSYRLSHLTAAGHDFADSARVQFIWDEVMTTMKEQGVVSASIDLLKRLLDKALRKRLEGDGS